MNNTDTKFKALAQRCLNQIGRIDRSSSLTAVASRMKSLEKWIAKFTKAAETESNKMLSAYEKEHGEEKAKAYREELIKAAQKQIKAFSKKIVG